MGLTDTSLVVVLAVVAVALFAVIVVGVPRRGRGVTRGVSRGVQVLVLNLLVVAICGAVLNDQYLFYSSWSDALGSRSGTVELHNGGSNHDVVSAKVAGRGLSGLTTPSSLPPLPQPGARLQSYTVVDKAAGVDGEVLVYLPAGYDASSSHAYPVMVGLHGFPGSPQSFVQLNVLPTLDSMTAEHKMAPTIVVIPRIDTPATLDTECVNGSAGQPQTDTWLAQDLPLWAAQHFHVQAIRTSWVAMGYSYGAWCAASVAMRHPDVFGAAIVMQGYFHPDFARNYDPLSKDSRRGYDLVHLAQTAPPPIAMWVLTSRQDSLSYPSTSKFLSVARRPLSVTATVLRQGGHRFDVWEPYVPASLTWLSQTLPGFHG